jgi:hypothetical protein
MMKIVLLAVLLAMSFVAMDVLGHSTSNAWV